MPVRLTLHFDQINIKSKYRVQSILAAYSLIILIRARLLGIPSDRILIKYSYLVSNCPFFDMSLSPFINVVRMSVHGPSVHPLHRMSFATDFTVCLGTCLPNLSCHRSAVRPSLSSTASIASS